MTTYDLDCTEPVQLKKLRQEAEEVLENMDSGDWQFWKQEYAEAGNDISENAHTAQEKEEMFIQEYIEANWVKE